MKTTRLIISFILVIILAATLLVGCSSCGSLPVEEPASGEESFSYSEGLDENGFWKDVRALDYVDLFEYEGFSLPKDVYEISDEDVTTQVNSYLSSYSTTQPITDRAAQEGDNLNIDYVGSVDGVEFEGGSTEGAGTDVTIGTTQYIEGFLEQLVGHSTGESFDITVTFPEDYGNEELNGKEAVFAITINSISETILPELTDSFVAENLSADNGWQTVKEMKDAIAQDLQDSAIQDYLREYMATEVTLSSIPESVISYQERSFVAYYESTALAYSMELDEFLSSYVGVTSMEELLTNSQETIRSNAVYSLVVQAIAEDAGITVTEEDLSEFFLAMGSSDYSSYEEQYGLPYLKQVVLGEKVLDLITEKSVFA